MTKHLDLTVDLDGREATRDRVLAWERERAVRVLRFLGGRKMRVDGDVDALRDRLFDLKRLLGPDEVQRRVAGQLLLSGPGQELLARQARGGRVASSIRTRVPSGTAQAFSDWFMAESELADSDAMLKACPDHYFIGEDDRGRQKVVERTGGAPLTTEFFIDYEDVSSLTTPASPEFPIQIAGVARAKDGFPIGGVRHQFRDLPEGGFEAWNTVEFPTRVGSRMVAGHRWHLACEFGNWIEFQQA